LYTDGLERLVGLLKLDSSGSKSLLGVDFGIILFSGFCLAAALLYDTLEIIIQWVSGQEGHYYTGYILVGAFVLLIVSYLGIVVHEAKIGKHQQ